MSEFADTSGGRLAYVRRGSGEPLLLIMGVAGHHRMWGEPFLSALSEDFDVVAFDHRGIGASSRSEGDFSIVDLADDAAAVLDHLGWGAAYVMGVSMGGAVAQELALRHPDRVCGLVLGCTFACPGSSPADFAWGDGIGKLIEAGSGDPAAVERLVFAANVSSTFAAEQGRLDEFSAVAGSVEVPGPVTMQQLQAAVGHDASDRLKHIQVPTLVIHGTEDQIITPRAGDLLASLIPEARIERLAGVGHLFFWEQPERAAALVASLPRKREVPTASG